MLAEAGVVAGVEFKVTGELEAKLGKHMTAKAQGTFKAFAGMYAHARGSAFVRKGERWWDVGAGASGRVEAQAGAKVGGEGSVAFDVGDLGLEGGVSGEAFAGAEVEAEGEVAIDLRAGEIAIGGRMGVFAGVRATGSTSGSARLYGRKAITQRVEVTAAAGAGTNWVGKFKLSRGVLNVSYGGDLAAGVGGGLIHESTVDFKPIAVFVARQVNQKTWAIMSKTGSGNIAGLLGQPDQVKAKLAADLRKYRDFKQRQLANKRADEFVKVEKVQMFIDFHLPRHKIKGRSDATAIDAFIKTLVETECSLPHAKVSVDVSDGKLTSLALTPSNAVKTLRGEQPDDEARAKLKEAGH